MYRLAALAIVLAASSLGEAQAQFFQPATLANNLGGDASKSGNAVAPGKENKPSKEQLAKKTLQEAEARHKDAVESADQAMSKLEDFVAHLYNGIEAKDVADSIQKAAEKSVQSGVQDAEEAFRGHLSALSRAKATDSLDDLEGEALKATVTVRQASRRQAHEMRKVMSQMQKDKRSEARELSLRARKAASAALKAARGLERAQRHAGVKERVYEGAYGHAESVLEHMEDRAEDLGGRAEDKVAAFFDRVEREVDRRSDSVDDGAARHARVLRHEVGHAREQAEEAAKRAERAAHATQAQAPAKTAEASPAKDDKQDEASPANKDKKDEASPAKEHSAGDGASKPAEDDDSVTLVGAERAVTVSPAVAFCAFCGAVVVSVSTGFVHRRLRRDVRDAAPLLG